MYYRLSEPHNPLAWGPASVVETPGENGTVRRQQRDLRQPLSHAERTDLQLHPRVPPRSELPVLRRRRQHVDLRWPLAVRERRLQPVPEVRLRRQRRGPFRRDRGSPAQLRHQHLSRLSCKDGVLYQSERQGRRQAEHLHRRDDRDMGFHQSVRTAIPINVAWMVDIDLDRDVARTCCSRRRTTVAACRPARAGWICGITTRAWTESACVPRRSPTRGRASTRARTTTPASVRSIRTTPTSPYISTDADPATGAPLISRADGKRHRELFRGERTSSGKWNWLPFTRNSTQDNLRPVIPKWDDRRTAMCGCAAPTCTTRASGISSMVAAIRPLSDVDRRAFLGSDRGEPARCRYRRTCSAGQQSGSQDRSRLLDQRLAAPARRSGAHEPGEDARADAGRAGARCGSRRSPTSRRSAGSRRHRAVARARRTRPARALSRAADAHRARRRSRVSRLAELHARPAAAGRRGVSRAGRCCARRTRSATRSSRRRRRHLVAALESTRAITPGFNNWLLFSATVEAGLTRLGARVGPHARRLRAAPARAVVQGRRRLRRRPDVPLGLLQQLRHPPDAARRARRVRRRIAGVEGDGRRVARARAALRRRPGAARRARRQLSRRSADRSPIAAARSTCWPQVALRRALPDGVVAGAGPRRADAR